MLQAACRTRKRGESMPSGGSSSLRRIRIKKAVRKLSSHSSSFSTDMSRVLLRRDAMAQGVSSSISAGRLLSATSRGIVDGNTITRQDHHRTAGNISKYASRNGTNWHCLNKSSDVRCNCTALENAESPQDDDFARGTKTVHLNDVHESVLAAKELLKMVLNILCTGDNVDPSTVSLMSALYCQLGIARAHVGQLMKEQRVVQDNVDERKNKTCCETAMKVLDREKKLRRRTERYSNKLRAELVAAREEAKRVCREVVEEVEKEREMLRLADEWREERVEVKLAEARLQFEEKNAALEELRSELEAYLRSATSRLGHQKKTVVMLQEVSDEEESCIELKVDNWRSAEEQDAQRCEASQRPSSPSSCRRVFFT